MSRVCSFHPSQLNQVFEEPAASSYLFKAEDIDILGSPGEQLLDLFASMCLRATTYTSEVEWSYNFSQTLPNYFDGGTATWELEAEDTASLSALSYNFGDSALFEDEWSIVDENTEALPRKYWNGPSLIAGSTDYQSSLDPAVDSPNNGENEFTFTLSGCTNPANDGTTTTTDDPSNLCQLTFGAVPSIRWMKKEDGHIDAYIVGPGVSFGTVGLNRVQSSGTTTVFLPDQAFCRTKTYQAESGTIVGGFSYSCPSRFGGSDLSVTIPVLSQGSPNIYPSSVFYVFNCTLAVYSSACYGKNEGVESDDTEDRPVWDRFTNLPLLNPRTAPAVLRDVP